jgi:hypothetical protein
MFIPKAALFCGNVTAAWVNICILAAISLTCLKHLPLIILVCMESWHAAPFCASLALQGLGSNMEGLPWPSWPISHNNSQQIK